MPSVKFKNLEVGRSYVAIIWNSSSKKDPVEVKVENLIDTGTGLRVVLDKFEAVQECGQVIHSITGKRVTFRTEGDMPEAANTNTAPPKTTEPKEKLYGEVAPRMAYPERKAPERAYKRRSGAPVLPKEVTTGWTTHTLLNPSGLEAPWFFHDGLWKLTSQSEGVKPESMGSSGYKYVGSVH